jgi:hypothetical protein
MVLFQRLRSIDRSAFSEFNLSAGVDLVQTHQASRTAGSWNAAKSPWTSGCMNAVKVAIPSPSSDRSCSECAFQRPWAPRV